MSDGSSEVSSDASPEEGSDTPEYFYIDDLLIKRWFALPADAPVQLAVTREAVDQLFTGISRSYFAVVAVSHLATAGDKAAREKYIKTAVDETTEGINGLRKFFAHVMASNTQSRLDETLRVIAEPDDE